jgi:hypothetical protein
MWFGVPGLEPENLRRVFLANLAAVVANYRDAGVIHFVFAGAVRDREEVGELEAAAGMPLRVVRLVVSREQVDQRLTNDPTSGRHGDLELAREWLTGGVGEGHRRSGGHERRSDRGSGNKDSRVALLVDPRGCTSG